VPLCKVFFTCKPAAHSVTPHTHTHPCMHHVIKYICSLSRAAVCDDQHCPSRSRCSAIASSCPARLSSSSAVRRAGPSRCEQVYNGFGGLIRGNRHAPVAPFYEPIAEALHRNQRVTRRLRAEQRVARFGRHNRKPRSGWSLGGRRLPAIEGKRRQAARSSGRGRAGAASSRHSCRQPADGTAAASACRPEPAIEKDITRIYQGKDGFADTRVRGSVGRCPLPYVARSRQRTSTNTSPSRQAAYTHRNDSKSKYNQACIGEIRVSRQVRQQREERECGQPMIAARPSIYAKKGKRLQQELAAVTSVYGNVGHEVV
jgi:hypothetical protein